MADILNLLLVALGAPIVLVCAAVAAVDMFLTGLRS